MNTTNLGTANGSAGAAGFVVVILIWLLSLVHVTVPNEVTVAMTSLAVIVTHSTVVMTLFKTPPPETTPAVTTPTTAPIPVVGPTINH